MLDRPSRMRDRFQKHRRPVRANNWSHARSATDTAGIPFVIVTGRMFRSVKRYLDELELDGLVVCYQGAVVADASGRFLRHVPIPLELAREAIAAVAGRYHVNCYVGDELYVAEVTEEAREYADFQRCRSTPWASCSVGWTAADEARRGRRPQDDERARARAEEPVRRSPLHLEVAAAVPGARGARG